MKQKQNKESCTYIKRSHRNKVKHTQLCTNATLNSTLINGKGKKTLPL